MKSEMGVNRPQETKFLHRLLAMLLGIIMVFSVCGNGIVVLAQELDSWITETFTREEEEREETREEIKARLMRQIKYEGWDPYSADMTLAEFYALMELFDEGKLPLSSAPSLWNSILSVLGLNDEPAAVAGETHILRTKFLYAGLGSYKPHDGDADKPLPYDSNTGAEDEPGDYPAGLDPYTAGYMRPPKNWEGIKLSDPKNNRVVIVSEGINDDNMAVAGDVNQTLFATYTGYYVKQVTIDGANVNVLGMIKLEDRFIYYYLSAEDQNTQVSTTTLPDEAKLIIEYVPEEHKIDYVVKLDDRDVTDETPEDVVIFGSNSPTEVRWVDSIFGVSHAHKTTDGAYSFDVFVPYGYELEIRISIDMEVQVPYVSKPDAAPDFPVEINHTGKKSDVHDAWLNAYYEYLQKEGFVDNRTDFDDHIIETPGSDGKITLEWRVISAEDELDKPAHDSILSRMAERINDFVEHNNGYPLGAYPNYTEKGEGGFKILPNANGPTEHTMNDTFYNHLVKADRIVTAVLKKQETPTFDVSQILKNSDGARNRGSSATEDFALASLKHYDEDYEFHKDGGQYNASNDPLGGHSAAYPNIKSEKNAWGWDGENDSFRGKPQEMKYDAETGTYYYTWLFQTNSNEGGYYLDAFEVNGIPITVPFYPKYNWNGSYVFQGETEKADEKHPYYTETTLADGSILRLEFLLGWNSNPPQRHYRVTVTGARSNVVVTGLNLMTGNGADEFVTYNLVGVYSDEGGYSQTAPAIEYYAQTGAWIRKAQANVIVDSDKNGIDYINGDTEHNGANIRFKITTGYGNPYYMWTNRHGDVINDQASAKFDEGGNIKSTNDIMSFVGLSDGDTLDSQYIYDGGDGYYYIRVTNQYNQNAGKNYKFALLTIVARTIKYTVRYTPEYAPNDNSDLAWHGFVMDPDHEGELRPLTQDWMDKHDNTVLDIDNMPSFDHNPEICDLWKMAIDTELGDVPDQYKAILHQYDDNEGPFYDLIFNTLATIATDAYGTIRPKDTNNRYIFQNWILVGADFKPVIDGDGNYIQFLGGAIDVVQYADYSVKHVAFGNADTDIHVFRLMPVWKYIEEPLVYSVILNWVDNLGIIHAEEFHDNWDDVVTEMTEDGQVFVYINKGARPFLDWIANHPTYTFWDDVNNAVDDGAGGKTAEDKIKEALNDYLERGGSDANYDNILNALMQRNFISADGEEIVGNTTFTRHGSDIFIVEDNGKICIWMYENKGGLVFHKDVQDEPFIPDDEFYFTIANAMVGEKFDKSLSGVYKAYPQFVYDEDGKPRDRTDADAWLVEFKDGKIVSINGNKKVTYFTLKSGEGIDLYVSAGQYTIVELGSKSGGAYKVEVTYTSSNGGVVPDDSWDIPDENDLWLRGSSKEYHDPSNLSDRVKQVTATVNFEVGEHNVVQTLTFCNKTASLSIEKQLGAKEADKEKLKAYQNTDFRFTVTLRLPHNYEPLLYTPLPDDNGESYFYFVMNIYNVADGSVVSTGKIVLTKSENSENGENVWIGTIKLKAGQRAAIVMTASADNSDINYWVEESDKPTIFTERWETQKSGTVTAGERAVAKVVNWYENVPDVEYGYLVITEKGGEDNESFLYRIRRKETDEWLIVSVKGGGETYVYAPLGEYIIEEISDWSWKYDEGKCVNSNTGTNSCTVEITAYNAEREKAVHADYTHKRNDKVWLGGESSEDNRFAAQPTTGEEEEPDSGESEAAMLAVYTDDKRKSGMVLQTEPRKRKWINKSDWF